MTGPYKNGAVRIASSAVGSTDAVGVLPTLKIGVVFTLEFNVASTLGGGTSSICSGTHLFCLGVWRLVRTLVSELKILKWFLISIALTGTIILNILRRSAAAMIVWLSSEIVGMRSWVRNSLYVPLLVQYPVSELLKYISQ